MLGCKDNDGIRSLACRHVSTATKRPIKVLFISHDAYRWGGAVPVESRRQDEGKWGLRDADNFGAWR